MKKAVIFDLDGTLLDTLVDLMDAVNYAMRKCGYPERSLEEIRRFVGNGVRVLVKRAVPNGTSDGDYEKAYAFFREYYKENMEKHTCPYDGIEELLSNLKKAGVKTAIVTNKADFAAIPLCNKMFPQVEVVIGTSEFVTPKPNPQGVFKALDILGVKKEEAYYVGDSEVDVQTALNSGLDLISVLWGFRTRAELEKTGVDFFVSSPKELETVLINGK